MSDVHDEYVAGDVNTIDDEADEFDNADEAARVLTTPTRAARVLTTPIGRSPRRGADLHRPVPGRGPERRLRGREPASRQGRAVAQRRSQRHGTNHRPSWPHRQAIRALVGAAGARDGVTTSVDIVD